MEHLNDNLLFRWFVGLSVDAPVRAPTVFTKNRDRLLEGDLAAAFMSAVLELPQVKGLLSDEYFSVDGNLIQAWARLAKGSARCNLVEWPDEASMKSFRRKDGQDEPPAPGRNGERTFKGEKRSNETHASITAPDAQLAKKSGGQEATLGLTGHLPMKNPNGPIVYARLTHATGTAEPEAVLDMLGALPGSGKKTVGAHKNYDTAAFVAASWELGVTPHVAQNITPHRGSNIDGRTAGSRKAAAYTLVRMPRLVATG